MVPCCTTNSALASSCATLDPPSDHTAPRMDSLVEPLPVGAAGCLPFFPSEALNLPLPFILRSRFPEGAVMGLDRCCPCALDSGGGCGPATQPCQAQPQAGEYSGTHLAWCCKLYRDQMDRGAYFLHEHPRMARSWQEPCIRALLARRGVGRVNADQCQLGQQDHLMNPIRKPTGFMSTSPEILNQLNVQCMGRRGSCSRPEGGLQARCLGARARRAAIFQDKLCLAILRGFRNQMIADKAMRRGEFGLVGERDLFEESNDYVEAFISEKSLSHTSSR